MSNLNQNHEADVGSDEAPATAVEAIYVHLVITKILASMQVAR